MKNLYLTQSRKQQRSAFTLVEILIVVSIIGILVATSSLVFNAVTKSQQRSRAVADMAELATGIEAFKGMYNDYPRLNFKSDGLQSSRKLYKCLVGLTYMTIESGQITFANINRDTDLKSFVEVSALETGTGEEEDLGKTISFMDPKACFIDPWGNAYEYYYDSSSAIGTMNGWDGPSFILKSPGPDGKSREINSMFSSGVMPKLDDYMNASPGNLDDIIYNFKE